MKEWDFNISIVGLGLIGGSYAMALKKLKPKNIWGIDIDKNAIETAEAKGIIDKGYLDPKIPLSQSDLVIIAVYPKLTVKFIKDNISSIKKGAIVTDTAGIKARVIEEINSFINDDIDFIGGHPMAGKENTGLEFASDEIFKNANYIITPTENNKKENIDLIEKMAREIGFKNVVKLQPEAHDEIIAFTSHIPHIMAVALINSDVYNEDTKFFVGGSFKDATRVALINSNLWSELLISNKENVLKVIDSFEKNISDIKNAVENNDVESLKDIFDNAGVRRRELVL